MICIPSAHKESLLAMMSVMQKIFFSYCPVGARHVSMQAFNGIGKDNMNIGEIGRNSRDTVSVESS